MKAIWFMSSCKYSPNAQLKPMKHTTSIIKMGHEKTKTQLWANKIVCSKIHHTLWNCTRPCKMHHSHIYRCWWYAETHGNSKAKTCSLFATHRIQPHQKCKEKHHSATLVHVCTSRILQTQKLDNTSPTWKFIKLYTVHKHPFHFFYFFKYTHSQPLQNETNCSIKATRFHTP